ncbi:glycosyltransferase [Alphaproteobacteria bacterium]|nr:glycosyltransferase [Alphaproteobacteria bacterium]
MVKKNPIKKKILIIASSFITIETFLEEFLAELSKKYDVSVATNLNEFNNNYLNFKNKYNYRLIHIPIRRRINFYFDFLTLISLFLIIKKNKFDLTLSLTPKAGLLTSISSYLNFIKIRIHIFNGQIWYNKKGFIRILLKYLDKITFFLSNYCLCESKSQIEFLFLEGFQSKKINVIAEGSLMGVDTSKFTKNDKIRIKLRDELNIKNNQKVCMYLGRLNYEKGLKLIVDASNYFEKYEDVLFILVGSSEINSIDLFKLFNLKKNIIYIGYKNKIENYLNICDFTVLPSYREGFGISVIEAASMEKPCLISNIHGIRDTVINNYSGLKFDIGNFNDFITKLEYMFKNLKKTRLMGKRARSMVKKKFEKKIVIDSYIKFIDNISNL